MADKYAHGVLNRMMANAISGKIIDEMEVDKKEISKNCTRILDDTYDFFNTYKKQLDANGVEGKMVKTLFSVAILSANNDNRIQNVRTFINNNYDNSTKIYSIVINIKSKFENTVFDIVSYIDRSIQNKKDKELKKEFVERYLGPLYDLYNDVAKDSSYNEISFNVFCQIMKVDWVLR